MSKPFNLADAKAGHPVSTGNGAYSVQIHDFAYKLKFFGEVLMGVATPSIGGFPCIAYWNLDGSRGPYTGDIDHLVMAPLGTVEGLEVYPGEMLLNAHGELTPVPYGLPFRASEWSWPKKYPTTRMFISEMAQVPYNSSIPGAQLEAVANAAIAHGIENGYLIGDPDAAPYVYADIPAAVRLREVAIARHFYAVAVDHLRTFQKEEPRSILTFAGMNDEFITAELTKVK